MTIYILDNNQMKCAEMLDDKSLDKMIKDISQVLCNVHYKPYNDGNSIVLASFGKKVPLVPKNYLKCKWSQWARECRANYLYLVELGFSCLEEIKKRFHKLNKKQCRKADVIGWANENIPDLPTSGCQCYEKDCPLDLYQTTPLPLVIPIKYHLGEWYLNNPDRNPSNTEYCKIESYRNYYNQNLKKKLSKCNSLFTSDNEIVGGHGDTRKEVEWTNRKMPEGN